MYQQVVVMVSIILMVPPLALSTRSIIEKKDFLTAFGWYLVMYFILIGGNWLYDGEVIW